MAVPISNSKGTHRTMLFGQKDGTFDNSGVVALRPNLEAVVGNTDQDVAWPV